MLPTVLSTLWPSLVNSTVGMCKSVYGTALPSSAGVRQFVPEKFVFGFLDYLYVFRVVGLGF